MAIATFFLVQVACLALTWEPAIDRDGDGFGPLEDCDDTNPDVRPDIDEIPYNGNDDDCDPNTPDDDIDGDGYGRSSDCDDGDGDISPSHAEIQYNEKDDDCDPSTPDDDIDRDGAIRATDCDDTDPRLSPDHVEIPYNDLDDDCDETTPDDDLDGDSFVEADDCDDNDPSLYYHVVKNDSPHKRSNLYQYTTIQGAIDSSLDIICIEPGRFSESLTIRRSLELWGAGSTVGTGQCGIPNQQEHTIIDANEIGSGIQVTTSAPVAVQNLHIQDGVAVNGGGIRASQLGVLELRGLVINGNQASARGGGIYGAGVSGNSDLFIFNSELCANESALSGGGIYVQESTTWLQNTDIWNNQVSEGDSTLEGGGGIHILDGDTTLSGAITVANNISSSNGGGIMVRAISAADDFALISDNSLDTDILINENGALGEQGGGGLYAKNYIVQLGDVSFLNNEATGDGGGVHASSTALTLIGAQVLGNSASESGGGLYTSQTEVELKSLMLAHNEAGLGGGWNDNQASSGTVLANCCVYDNWAEQDGGGIRMFAANSPHEYILNTVDFMENNAGRQGADVYVGGEANVELRHCETRTGTLLYQEDTSTELVSDCSGYNSSRFRPCGKWSL